MGRLLPLAAAAATVLLPACDATTFHTQKHALIKPVTLTRTTTTPSWNVVPRGGADVASAAAATAAATATVSEKSASIGSMVVSAVDGLKEYMDGAKGDTLLLLVTTALNTPLCKIIGMSPILGFLALGLAAGPKGFNLVKDVHTTEMIADLGVVLFLFEMGVHLRYVLFRLFSCAMLASVQLIVSVMKRTPVHKNQLS